MVPIDVKLMISYYWHKRYQKRVDKDAMVPPLELNEVGGFDQLEMKRGKLEA